MTDEDSDTMNNLQYKYINADMHLVLSILCNVVADGVSFT